ncbi:MAG: hypothetical protein ABI857_11905 [Acidobacteriota bacterium]
MKTILRFLGTGVLSATILAVGAVAGFGQDANANCTDIDGHNALYTKFLGVYSKKSLPDMETALSTGKEYLEKFGTCAEAFKDQIDFVRPHVSRIEKELPDARDRAKLAPFFAQFDKGLAAGNVDDVLAAGKEILNVKKEDVNIAFAMALIAADKSTPANQFKYANDAITYSKLVSSKVKGGWQFDRKYNEGPKKGSPYIGIGTYNRDNRDLVTAELNYNVAYQTFYGKKDMKTAVPLYYELSQSATGKDDPRVFGAIGDYYVAEGAPIGDEIAKLIQQIKDATDEKVKVDLDTQVKAKIALFNGYLERSIDAYGRAHSVAKPGPYKDGLYKQLQAIYRRRTDKDSGLTEYVATMITKPFPNPTTPVTPVSDSAPPTTTGTVAPTTAAPTVAAPASTTATKPATKPMSTTVTKSSVAKTVAKKGPRR